MLYGYVGLAQIQVELSDDTDEMIRNTLFSEKSGVKVIHLTSYGSTAAIGYFTMNLMYNELLDSGLIMSTGAARDIVGPNNTTGKTTHYLSIGDPNLSKMIGRKKTFDLSAIRILFIPKYDSISFNYFFASEEYPEYVNSNVNDVFGFFLKQKSSGEMINLAVLPDGKTSVCVDEINSESNSNFYRANGFLEKGKLSKWAKDLKGGEMASYFQMDGYTTLLSAGAKVIPGEVYDIIMIIADVGDARYDSAIFLQAGSFTSSQTDADTLQIASLFDGKGAHLDDGSFKVDHLLQFDFGSAIISDSQSYYFLDTLAASILRSELKSIQITGHTDTIGSIKENQQLSLERAETIKNYFVLKGIPPEIIAYEGKGETEATGKVDQALYRKVTFVFK